LGVNAIPRQAGVDEVVSRRCFGGLPEQLQRLGWVGGSGKRRVAAGGGVQNLQLHSRKIRLFGGLDWGGDTGWAMREASARAMAQAVFVERGAGSCDQGAAAASTSGPTPPSVPAAPKLSLKVNSSEM